MRGLGNALRRTVLRGSLQDYVAAWALLAVGVVLLVALTGTGRSVHPPTLLVLFALTMAAEGVTVTVRTSGSTIAVSLVETAVVVALLLLPAGEAILVVVAAIGVHHLLHRRDALKILFNMAQHGVGVGVAALLAGLAPASPTLSVGRVLAIALGVSAYRLVSNVALVGVYARLDAGDLRDLMERPLALAANALGNASLGVIAVNLWLTAPELVWVVTGPTIALYLAYVAGFRIEGLLADVRIERDRLGRVVSGVGDGIVLLGADGTILVWNRPMAAILGVDEAEALGCRAEELLSGLDDQGAPLDPLATGHEHTRGPTGLVVHVRAADGDRRPLRITRNPLREDGRRAGDVLVVQDLTREREANALKEDFVAQVSHELRTPLSPLRGYAQALRQAGDRIPAEKRAEIHGLMVERVDHLERLVDDLLLVSAIGAGRSEPARHVQCVPVELGPLLPRLVSWLSAEQTAGRRIVVHAPDGLGRVHGDATRIGQVVTNLLTNACKYSAPDTEVTVEVTAADGQVHVAVRDHGPGIPADKLEAVFERFERLDDPQRMKAGGIGLGLYISRYLAEAMGGRLTASSVQGVGSTFVLSLPALPDEIAGDDGSRAPVHGVGAVA